MEENSKRGDTAASGPCPVCSHPALSTLGKRSDFGDLQAYRRNVKDPLQFDREILACQRCGVQFSHPPYDQRELDELYNGPGYVELMQGMLHATPSAANLRAWCAEYGELGVAQIAEAARRDGRVPRMLDVGCGMGNGLRIFERLGFHATGIDLSEVEIAHLARTSDFTVFRESAAQHRERGQRYDVVLATHVIEHVEEPREFLAQLFALLAPSGSIIVETPLTNDYGAVAERYRDIYHTYFFDHFSLALLASRVGLAPTRWQNLLSYGPGDWSWNAFVRVTLRDAGERSAEQDPLPALRHAYDGLLDAAHEWSRAALAVERPWPAARYGLHNRVRRLLREAERTHPALHRVRDGLQRVRRYVRKSAF